MSLETQINEAIKEAMKAQNEARKRALRAVKAEILLIKTDGTAEGLTEEKGIKLLQKMVKQREDSFTVFSQQNREDLANIEREELEIIREFLPKQLSETELVTILQTIITEVGASSPKDMGKVIGAANKQLQGKADGKIIAEWVKKLLAAI
jgi:uncharacterized protein